MSFETDARAATAAHGRQKGKDAQRVQPHQGVGHARGEIRDRSQSRRPLVERIELLAPARLGDASSIDDRSAGYSGPVKINADLGRFGGLIKMWLTTNADFESLSAQGLQRKLESTLSDVRLLQKKMSESLEDL